MLIDNIISCACVFAASFAFGIMFNIRGKKLFFSALGGLLSWSVYLVSAGIYENDIPQYFLAAAAVSVYAEVMARITKVPVTVYLVISLLPLVPGGAIYKAMVEFVDGNSDIFIEKLLYTFGVAGAIALAVFTVSSITKTITDILRSRRKKRL